MSSGIRKVALLCAMLSPVVAPAQGSAQAAAPRSIVRLPPPPVLPDSVEETPPPRHQIWVTDKRWGLAVPGALGGNIIPMIYNEFLQNWKDISRTSPYSWFLYGPLWEWDDNHFFNNQLFHPIQGSFYYGAGRSNGFNYWESTLFALGGSFLWECCGERRPGSWNDLLTTTLGGAGLGEMLFRGTSLFLDQTLRGLDRIGVEALLLPLNTERFLARGIYGSWKDRTPRPDRIPERWGMALGVGSRWTGGSGHPFFDIQLRYGSLFGPDIHAPFDVFTVDAQFNGRDQPIGLVQVRAHLWQSTLWGLPIEEGVDGHQLKMYFSQSYDYLDSSPDWDLALAEGREPDRNSGYRYGGQSFGVGLAGARVRSGLSMSGQVEAHGVAIGAVNSNVSTYTGIMPERVREYDFGFGGGIRGWGGMQWHGAKIDASYMLTKLATQSFCAAHDAPVPCTNPGHRIQLATAGIKVELDNVLEFIVRYPVPWARHVWIGGDYLWFQKQSDYPPLESNSTDQWRIVLSWDLTKAGGNRVYGH